MEQDCDYPHATKTDIHSHLTSSMYYWWFLSVIVCDSKYIAVGIMIFTDGVAV